MAAALSEKALAKKLGVSESFVIDVEQGRKVVNESMIGKFSKILQINVSDLGLNSLETEVVREDREVERQSRLKPTVSKPPAAKTEMKPNTRPTEELWSQAFGENLKNVPILETDLTTPAGKRLYPVENGRIREHNTDKVVLVKCPTDELEGFLIGKGALLMGVPVKEIAEDGIYLIAVDGKQMIRKMRNLHNGNCLAIAKKDREISFTAALREIKPLLKFFSVETSL